eukprot:1822764-Prymnesium_polylepis.3
MLVVCSKCCTHSDAARWLGCVIRSAHVHVKTVPKTCKSDVKCQIFPACGGLLPPAAPAAGSQRFRAFSPPDTPVAKNGAVSCSIETKRDLKALTYCSPLSTKWRH